MSRLIEIQRDLENIWEPGTEKRQWEKLSVSVSQITLMTYFVYQVLFACYLYCSGSVFQVDVLTLQDTVNISLNTCSTWVIILINSLLLVRKGVFTVELYLILSYRLRVRSHSPYWLHRPSCLMGTWEIVWWAISSTLLLSPPLFRNLAVGVCQWWVM
jgi:hypothetical protein